MGRGRRSDSDSQRRAVCDGKEACQGIASRFPDACVDGAPAKPVRSPSGSWVATVVSSIQTKPSLEGRMYVSGEVLSAIMRNSRGKGIVLFPGGWFDAGAKKPERTVEDASGLFGALLTESERPVVVCLGVDGRNTKDQLALAVDADRMLALARKFHPTDDEEGKVQLGSSENGEEGYRRVVKLGGRTYFLAVCYDCFAPKQLNLPNPGVDGVLTLAHGFGEESKGLSYYARFGLGGTSHQWGCPVYGAAVFHGKPVSMTWPTGVYFVAGDVRGCTYKQISIRPLLELGVDCGVEKCVVRFFDTAAIR